DNKNFRDDHGEQQKSALANVGSAPQSADKNGGNRHQQPDNGVGVEFAVAGKTENIQFALPEVANFHTDKKQQAASGDETSELPDRREIVSVHQQRQNNRQAVGQQQQIEQRAR